MKEITQNNATHRLGYHIVFCTKYRQRALEGAVEVECKKIIAEICKDNNYLLHSIEVMPDHVHVFVQLDHLTAPVYAVKMLKACSAIHLFNKFPTLKARRFWGSGLWSGGTFYSTVGAITEETVTRYINMQKSDSSEG